MESVKKHLHVVLSELLTAEECPHTGFYKEQMDASEVNL